METKKDYTSEFQSLVTETASLSLDDSITQFLSLEKKCRVNNDFTNLNKVCLHMVIILKFLLKLYSINY